MSNCLCSLVFLSALLLLLPAAAAHGANWRSEAAKAVLDYGRKYVKDYVFHLSVIAGVELLKEHIWSPKGPQHEETPPSEETKRFVEVYKHMIADKDFLARLDRNVAANLQRWDWCRAMDPDLAIRGCTAVIQYSTDPKIDMATVFNNRAYAYDQKGERDRAIQDYSQAIMFNPGLWQAYNNRGVVFAETGQHERALRDFDTYVRLKPDHALAYFNRGLVYHDLRQLERAIQEYNVALRLSPSYFDALLNRGIANSNLERYDAALQDLNRAAEKRPRSALVYMNRGAVYNSLGDFERAVADLARGIEIDPKVSCSLLADWKDARARYPQLPCPAN